MSGVYVSTYKLIKMELKIRIRFWQFYIHYKGIVLYVHLI